MRESGEERRWRGRKRNEGRPERLLERRKRRAS